MAQGRIKLAEANQRELEAAAAGNKANLLAVAAGHQADLEAEGKGQEALAAGRKAMLLAEADGAMAKAKAFKELDDAGRFLMILQALPPVIDALGTAVEKSVKPFAEAIGEGLGNIDEVRIVNLGAGQPGGQNLLAQFANTPVEALFGLVQKLKSTDMWPTIVAAAKAAGIDVDKLVASAASAHTPAVEGEHHAPAAAPRADNQD
jgi:uncharacterized membrane protein YqiK